jgi:hypothetical protein
MPPILQEIPHEPIVVITYIDPYDPDDIAPVFQYIADLAHFVPRIYVVDDLSQLDLNAGDLTVTLQQMANAGPGSPSDPHALHMLVGTDEMITFAAEAADQEPYSSLDMAFFPSIDDALAFVYNRQ